jgi:hypothetical protein
MKITHKQLLWARSRGGRDLSDIVVENGKPCVEMTNGFNPILVEIPDDDHITLYIDGKGIVRERERATD